MREYLIEDEDIYTIADLYREDMQAKIAVIEAQQEVINKLQRKIEKLQTKNKNLEASLNTQVYVAEYFKTKSNEEKPKLTRGELFTKMNWR